MLPQRSLQRALFTHTMLLQGTESLVIFTLLLCVSFILHLNTHSITLQSTINPTIQRTTLNPSTKTESPNSNSKVPSAKTHVFKKHIRPPFQPRRQLHRFRTPCRRTGSRVCKRTHNLRPRRPRRIASQSRIYSQTTTANSGSCEDY
jgi:hypothetical protein